MEIFIYSIFTRLSTRLKRFERMRIKSVWIDTRTIIVFVLAFAINWSTLFDRPTIKCGINLTTSLRMYVLLLILYVVYMCEWHIWIPRLRKGILKIHAWLYLWALYLVDVKTRRCFFLNIWIKKMNSTTSIDMILLLYADLRCHIHSSACILIAADEN